VVLDKEGEVQLDRSYESGRSVS